MPLIYCIVIELFFMILLVVILIYLMEFLRIPTKKSLSFLLLMSALFFLFLVLVFFATLSYWYHLIPMYMHFESGLDILLGLGRQKSTITILLALYVIITASFVGLKEAIRCILSTTKNYKYHLNVQNSTITAWITGLVLIFITGDIMYQAGYIDAYTLSNHFSDLYLSTGYRLVRESIFYEAVLIVSEMITIIAMSFSFTHIYNCYS